MYTMRSAFRCAARWWVAVLALSCAMALLTIAAVPSQGQTAAQPLDALTAPEMWATYDTMHDSGHLEANARITMVNLHEPPKDEVLAWKPGMAFRREALVVVLQSTHTYEAIVDVTARKVISWKMIPGAQANLQGPEILGIDAEVKADPQVQAALKKRGITDLTTVICAGVTVGNFGTPEEQGRRLQSIMFLDRHGVWESFARPIEGLSVIWDADAHKLLSIKDSEVVPVPQAPANFGAGEAGPLREIPTPIRVEQPLGPSFKLDGNEVSWQKWHFHFRIDERVGLVVSRVEYADGGKLRSVLYEGSLSEIFVPYQDPDSVWYRRTYFDAGEFGDGFSTPLEPGEDCPENAVYFEQIFADQHGIPQRLPRAACLFEQEAGDIAWRHMGDDKVVVSRAGRNLVLRTIGAFGNYDYVLDWVFQQDGTIRVRVGATGLDEVKGVIPRGAQDDRDGSASEYGRFVAENTVGVNHDHYFSFRLDFDLDGVKNSLVRDRLTRKRLPAGSLRKSVWVAEPQVTKTEEQAKAKMSMETPEIWRVINPSVKGAFGYPVGYEIMPGDNAVSLLSPDDPPQQRAGFADYQLWVTPYAADERYAAGDYPNQSKPGEGLPAWTQANRGIENTDIVVWYTMGFHHVPHTEDWPVMPTVWHEFELRPYNFFNRNAAVDLPK
jgi:primary-amine oxidase